MEKTKSKASRAEILERVAEVLRIRLDGASFLDVCTYAKQKNWSVSERQCGRYIAKADEMLAAQTDKHRRRQINLHMARRESLYARCVNSAAYGDALRVLTDLAKLQDLYASSADIRELKKLFIVQGEQLKKIEEQLNAEHQGTETDHPGASPEADPGRGSSPPTAAG